MMRNHAWRGALFVLLAFCSAVVLAAQSPEFELTVQGQIEIGPDGKVLDYRIEDETADAVQSLVARAVRDWRFEPVTVDGRPVIAMTDMKIALAAVPKDGDYLLRIDHVWFGTRGARDAKPPDYPVSLLRKSVTGTVILVLQLDETGRVARTHVERVDLGVTGSKSSMRRWSARFAKAAVEAAEDWRWKPFEFVDGKPVSTNVRVPVDFSFEGSTWTTHYRGESTPAPWIEADEPGQHFASTDPDPGGGSGSVNSRFHLLDDVEGTTL